MNNYFLTRNFRVSEFFNTSHMKHLYTNEHEFFSDPSFLVRACQIALILENIRAAVKCPIRINSGFRYPALNKDVGGVNKSQHLCMLAVDITCRNLNTLKQYLEDAKLPYLYQVIFYDTFVHIGFFDPINVPYSITKPIFLDKQTFTLN